MIASGIEIECFSTSHYHLWHPIWLRPVQPLCMLLPSPCIEMCVSSVALQTFDSLVSSIPPAQSLRVILHPLLQNSFNPEGGSLWRHSNYDGVFQGLSPSAQCPVLSFFVSSHLLQEKASLVMVVLNPYL